MGKFTRSQRTKRDIQDITKRSIADFGEARTLQYMAELHAKMQLLAETPDIGRFYVHSRTERQYLCFPHESHMIYYRKRKNDIFVTRILHMRMIPEKHL